MFLDLDGESPPTDLKGVSWPGRGVGSVVTAPALLPCNSGGGSGNFLENKF
jgi:hypothetical protein